MRILQDIREYDMGPSVLVMGKFDGVHLGHRMLLDEAVAIARARNAVPVALTFDRHPHSVLQPQSPPQALTSGTERAALIASRGIQVLIEQPFTQRFSQWEPEDYLRALHERLRMRCIVCGGNARFGHGARGDAALIRRMGAQLGYETVVMDPLRMAGEVSSTAIRRLMDEGDIEGAERLLGRTIYKGGDSL